MRKLNYLIKKNSYSGKDIFKAVRSAGLAFVFLLLVQSAFGQISWTGTFGTSATDARNWEPQLLPEGQTVVLDSAYKFANVPTFDGAVNLSVARMTLSPTTRFNVHMGDKSLQFKNNDGSSTYLPHDVTINVTQGEFYTRKNFYLDDSLAIINISGDGSVRTGTFFAMSKLGTPRGGFVNITGNGFMYCDVWPDRYSNVDSTKGVISITDNGYLDLKGDATVAPNLITTAIARNQIKTAADRDIVMHYDAITNRTKLFTRLKMAFIVGPTVTQKLMANSPGDAISVVHNDGWASMVSFQWKSTKTSGSGYTNIAGATSDSWVPTFTQAGTYYVVCVGNNGSTNVTSNEVMFVVSSDLVHITPPGRQLLKAGQAGYMLTITEDQAATSREWKYTQTTGSGYMSFTPAQTGVEYTPVFNTAGDYYVICESMIGGNPNGSSEVTVNVVDTTTNSDIFWKGDVDDNFSNMLNWDPHAIVYNNTITIDTGYANAPVLTEPGKHVIYGMNLKADASLTIDMPSLSDTLYRGSDLYINGDVIVNGGVFYLKGRLRMEAATPSITVTGGKIHMTTDFIVGTSSGSTGAKFINITGPGVIDAGTQIWRYATDTTLSVITINEGGKLIVHGDYRGGFESAMAKNQIMAGEGTELVMVYPSILAGDDTTTLLYSKSLLAFSVEPAAAQYLAMGEASAALSTINNSSVTSYQWKYSTTSGSGYVAFDPDLTGSTATPSFSAAGSYYVICEGTTPGGVDVSNEVNMIVVGVSVAPADAQAIEVKVSGTKLSVTESVAATSREWKNTKTSGSAYVSFLPKQTGVDYTPIFINAGTYYVVCESVVGGKTFRSNEVTVVVSNPVGVANANAGSFSVYPNPANKDFFIEASLYDNYKVKVINMQGKIVMNRAFNNALGRQKITIEKAGMYVIQIETNDSVNTSWIVIE